MRSFMLACLMILPTSALGELLVSDAWIRHLPPGAPVRAGYLVLENRQTSAVTIVAITSPAFAGIEIHRTIEQDGMMRMQRLTRLEVPAQSSLRLAPGGLHLMMTPLEPTTPGMQIPVRLVLADGHEIEIEMTVRK